MIKFHDANIADVAVRAARRSESKARLTELKFEDYGRVRLIDLQVVDALLSGDVVVLVWKVAFHFIPAARWYDTWVPWGGVDHEKVSHEEEIPEEADKHFPSSWAIEVEL